MSAAKPALSLEAITQRIFVLRDGVSVAELEGERATEEQILAAMAHGSGVHAEAQP